MHDAVHALQSAWLPHACIEMDAHFEWACTQHISRLFHAAWSDKRCRPILKVLKSATKTIKYLSVDCYVIYSLYSVYQLSEKLRKPDSQCTDVWTREWPASGAIHHAPHAVNISEYRTNIYLHFTYTCSALLCLHLYIAWIFTMNMEHQGNTIGIMHESSIIYNNRVKQTCMHRIHKYISCISIHKYSLYRSPFNARRDAIYIYTLHCMCASMNGRLNTAHIRYGHYHVIVPPLPMYTHKDA